MIFKLGARTRCLTQKTKKLPGEAEMLPRGALWLLDPDAFRVYVIAADILVGDHIALNGIKVIPVSGCRTLEPSGHHVAIRVKIVPEAVDLLPVTGRVGMVSVAVPPADGISEPRS